MTDVSQLSMAFPLNARLAEWAFARTKDTAIPDDAVVRERRSAWKGFPQAQRPPFVLLGETLGARRYWHGDARTKWAEDWVKLWTGGKGLFVMTNMESQTNQEMMRVLGAQGLVDLQRVMVCGRRVTFRSRRRGLR